MYSGRSAAILLVSVIVLSFTSAHPLSGNDLEERQSSCTFEQKQAAIQAEINTISSHSLSDANKIPLDPLASRTFYITPSELGITLPPVNVGVTAATVRAELVALGTALGAAVPGNQATYIQNSDGSVTSNFIQTDRIVLPRVQVSENHQFNSACQISKIVGTVKGSLVCPGGKSPSSNPVLSTICAAFGAAGGVSDLTGTVGGLLDNVL